MGSTTGQATLDLLRSVWVPACMYVYELVHTFCPTRPREGMRTGHTDSALGTHSGFSAGATCLCGRASAPRSCFCLLVFPPDASPFCFLTSPPVSQTLDIFQKLTFSFCHVISWFTGSPSFGDLTLPAKFLRIHVLNSPDLCFLGTWDVDCSTDSVIFLWVHNFFPDVTLDWHRTFTTFFCLWSLFSWHYILTGAG